jgi:hypothetical protein
MKPVARPRRVRIERVELDLRGIAPATAEAAARALGPALVEALRSEPGRFAAAERIDAGRIASAAAPRAASLAGDIARRIAGSATRARP